MPNNVDLPQDRIANRALNPETLMAGHCYTPGLVTGELLPTCEIAIYVFGSARQGKDFFDLTSPSPAQADILRSQSGET